MVLIIGNQPKIPRTIKDIYTRHHFFFFSSELIISVGIKYINKEKITLSPGPSFPSLEKYRRRPNNGISYRVYSIRGHGNS